MAERRFNLLALPPEVQLLVLQELVDGHNSDKSRRQGIAQYASVCRSWQDFFERLTFKYLILQSYDLPKLRHVTQRCRRRRLFVQHIWLRIEEPSPDRREALGMVENGWSKTIFTNAISHLWTTLSDWKTIDTSDGPNNDDARELTLELSSRAFSALQYAHLAPPDDLGAYSKYLETGGSLEAYDDVERFYYKESDRSHITVNNRAAKETLFSQGVRFDYTKSLPQVEVVTRFLIRRPETRNLRPELLLRVLRSLPRLRDIRIERWRHGYAAHETNWLLAISAGLPHHLQPGLERLAIFEDICTQGRRFDMFSKQALAESIIRGTLDIQRLSLCFFVEATDFLRGIFKSYREHRGGPFLPSYSDIAYKKLTTLTLTSSCLKADVREGWDTQSWTRGATDLCLIAAEAATYMPKLRLMEVWNSRGGQANVFRYEIAEDNIAEITWLGTQGCFSFDQDVSQAWKQVALQNGWHDLRTRVTLLPPGNYEYYGTVISHLKSRDMVLHPVSAVQIR